jgi:phosphopantothenate-cysteine ligase
MKKVLITSGGTMEYIDDVRVLTNISTGRLGSIIAKRFASETFVYYLHGKNTIRPSMHPHIEPYEVTDVSSLMKIMKEVVPRVDLVIHAMAVSDFGFDKKNALKLKSNDPQAFIEYLSTNIKVNPKVISYIKTWNPNVKLVGFKFEVGSTFSELVQLARDSIQHNKCDLVVANDKAEMLNRKSHVAYLINPDGTFNQVFEKIYIAEELFKWWKKQ